MKIDESNSPTMKTSSAQSKVPSIPRSSLKTWTEYPREEVLVKAGAEGAKAAAPAARVATIASFMVDYWGCSSVIKEFYGERRGIALMWVWICLASTSSPKEPGKKEKKLFCDVHRTFYFTPK